MGHLLHPALCRDVANPAPHTAVCVNTEWLPVSGAHAATGLPLTPGPAHVQYPFPGHHAIYLIPTHSGIVHKKLIALAQGDRQVI